MTLSMSNADRTALREAAQAVPGNSHHIKRAEIVHFLECCAQQRVPLKKVLDLMDPKTNARWQTWRDKITASGYTIKQKPLPMWCEVPVAIIDNDAVAEWEAPVVVITSEPLVTRARKYSELHMFHSRVVSAATRYFCPCSDGRRYFDADKIDDIEAAEPTLITMLGEDVPENDP